MSISREGLNLLKELEGYRPRAVSLASGRWLIGYGHTKYARANMRITEQEAELLLRHDMLWVVDELNTRIFAPLSQGQFDALALFAYNIGLPSFRASGVCDLLNIGQPLAAAKEIGRWRVAMVNGAPVVIDALARRRAAELDLFLRTTDQVRPATTHLLTPLSEQSPTAEQFDSPLQVFRPAPAPSPEARTAPSPAADPAPQVQEPLPEAPIVAPRPPSTLRTRFHDLIARRREADQPDNSLSVRDTEIGEVGVQALEIAIFIFAIISLYGFIVRDAGPPVAFGGLSAAVLCALVLRRLRTRSPASTDETPEDETPPA